MRPMKKALPHIYQQKRICYSQSLQKHLAKKNTGNRSDVKMSTHTHIHYLAMLVMSPCSRSKLENCWAKSIYFVIEVWVFDHEQANDSRV